MPDPTTHIHTHPGSATIPAERAETEPRPPRGYAVAHLWDVTFGPDIVEYLRRIDGTLEPYQGEFLIHGSQPELLEGDWKGYLVVVAFPSRQHARDWYESTAYQAILPLRTGNSQGTALLLEGVPPQHRAPDILG